MLKTLRKFGIFSKTEKSVQILDIATDAWQPSKKKKPKIRWLTVVKKKLGAITQKVLMNLTRSKRV